MTPEASRMVAGGPSEASDRRKRIVHYHRPRRGRGPNPELREFLRDRCRGRIPPRIRNRRSLATLGPPATVRVALRQPQDDSHDTCHPLLLTFRMILFAVSQYTGPMTPERDWAGWTKFVWRIYIIPFAGYPLLAHEGAGRIALTWFATAVFIAIYLAGYRVRGPRLLWIIAAITVLGVAFMPINSGAGAFFIFAASFAGSTATMRKAVLVIGIVLLVLLVDVFVIGLSPLIWWWAAFFTVAIGAVSAHFAQAGRANRRLQLAQDEIEHLAKVAERERIARDLHDVLGHTLSLIILKSELASKLADRDPQRARDEIRDVERISREALSEVRQAVRGYRAGLQQELDGATAMLRAAAIELTTEIDPVPLAAGQEAILALALREAVTNVVRHSEATRCTIALHRVGDDIRLIVSDDGRGGGTDGAGISGMRERIAALGGSVARDGSRGTTLTVTLPLASGLQSVSAIERSA